MAKASDLLVAALQAEGVEYVFGIPGEENLDLLESLRTSGIRLVLTRHEQAAGFMLSLQKGKPFDLCCRVWLPARIEDTALRPARAAGTGARR